ncbi:hypothetical protein AB0433_38305, partial [Streptomyces coelicoflavus]
RLRSRFGRSWRRKAPVESLMPLRLARYGVPLAQTAPSGLAAAGIEPALLPPAPEADRVADGRAAGAAAQVGAGAPPAEQRPELEARQQQAGQRPVEEQPAPDGPEQSPWFNTRQVAYQGSYDPTYDPAEQYAQWYEEQQQADQYRDQYEEEPPLQEPSPEETGSFPIPVAPGRTRELGEGGGTGEPAPTEEDYYTVFRKSIDGSYPTVAQFRGDVEATFGVPLAAREADRMVKAFSERHMRELQEEHIA